MKYRGMHNQRIVCKELGLGIRGNHIIKPRIYVRLQLV